MSYLPVQRLSKKELRQLTEKLIASQSDVKIKRIPPSRSSKLTGKDWDRIVQSPSTVDPTKLQKQKEDKYFRNFVDNQFPSVKVTP